MLIRRAIGNGDLRFFTTYCPAGADIPTLVRIEGQRWTIEHSFHKTRNELGLYQNKSRSWRGWHRYDPMVMLAFAVIAAVQHAADVAPPPKRLLWNCAQTELIRWFVQEVERTATQLALRRIQPFYIIAWPCWRKPHQAATKRAHVRAQL